MEGDIRNIYLLEINPNYRMFIFSVTDPEDQLKYDYYMLSLRRGSKPTIIKTNNVLQSLKNYQGKIIKISKKDELYDSFITYLKKAQLLKIKRSLKKHPKKDTHSYKSSTR